MMQRRPNPTELRSMDPFVGGGGVKNPKKLPTSFLDGPYAVQWGNIRGNCSYVDFLLLL